MRPILLRHRSDPTHPQYGQYMTQDEVRALTAPAPALVSRVLDYLQRSADAPNVVCDVLGACVWSRWSQS